MKWLWKNWLKIVIALCAILFLLLCINLVIGFVELVKDNMLYEMDIEVKDEEIRKKKLSIQADQEIIKGLENEREKDKAIAAEKIRKMKENQKRELARISSDRDEWREKVKNLPASSVVIKIRTIIKNKEVWLRPGGVLFSLVAARNCLAILGDFSLKKERDQFEKDYNTAMSAVEDLERVAEADEKIFSFFRKIGISKDNITGTWTEKFSLSEKRFKASWWRGAKQGGLVLGILGFIGGLVLGK